MSSPEGDEVAGKCRVMMHDGKECAREAYDGAGLCICHSGDTNKDAEAIQREINAMLARKDYDFTGFVFPEGISFRDARFEGDAYFYRATFQGEASFVRATFQDEADFVAATFQGEASFYEATFQGYAHFVGARFQDKAAFRATFQGPASFLAATFQGEADFVAATFQGEAGFHAATFGGEANFGWATFQGEASFGWATFEGEVRFRGEGEVRLFSSEAEADFRNARFGQPEKVVFQHVFLGRARFLDTDVRRVDFTDVQWATRRGGHCAVWDELAPEDVEKDYALIGKLYRQLKHNYEEQRDPITAGDFHIGEMQMRRLSNPPKNWLWRFLKRNLSFLALYRWISGYGEDYVRPLAWIVGVILVFAAAFTLSPGRALQSSAASGTPEPVHGWWPRLLHSVMCFLWRGGRPFQPVHLVGHYVSVAEGIIGPPLIAMFVLALNRRFKR